MMMIEESFWQVETYCLEFLKGEKERGNRRFSVEIKRKKVKKRERERNGNIGGFCFREIEREIKNEKAKALEVISVNCTPVIKRREKGTWRTRENNAVNQ